MTSARLCPTCLEEGFAVRIGNRRTQCKTCNSFAAKVRGRVCSELRSRHASEAEDIREEVEDRLFKEVTGSER